MGVKRGVFADELLVDLEDAAELRGQVLGVACG
jgi:hypothetical protein